MVALATFEIIWFSEPRPFVLVPVCLMARIPLVNAPARVLAVVPLTLRIPAEDKVPVPAVVVATLKTTANADNKVPAREELEPVLTVLITTEVIVPVPAVLVAPKRLTIELAERVPVPVVAVLELRFAEALELKVPVTSV